jgi:hypothetical protein
VASRKEQKEALRQERLEREQAAEQAAARKRLIGMVVAGILVLGIVGALAAVLLSGGDDDGGGGSGGDSGGEVAQVSFPDGGEIPEQKEADPDRAAKAAGCEHETFQAAGSGDHTTEPVEYETEPPALGPHYPDWPEDDIFEEAPQTERIVHTLEHGRILIWVRPDATEEQLAQFKALYEEDPYHVIMLPRKELKEAVAASAWVGQDTGHILRCDKVNDSTWDAIRAFKTEYRDKGPEFVP